MRPLVVMGVVSALGFVGALRRHVDVPAAFAPAIVCSGALVAVFVGGLIGHLDASVVVVLLVGLALFTTELLRRPRQLLGVLREGPLLLFGALVVVAATILEGRKFTHYDDFSHWAVVLRTMLETARFPDRSESLLTFTSYPLGPASFEYLVARIGGEAEWQLMMGMAILLLSYLVSLLSLIPRRPLLGSAAVVATVAAFATYATSMASLLVDSLLAAMGASAVALVLVTRRRLGANILGLALILGALASTKTSGLYFVVVVTVLLLAIIVRSGGRPPWRLAFLAVPWLLLLAWNRHVAATFPGAGQSKHSVSLDRLRAVWSAKTPAEVDLIMGAYQERALSDGLFYGFLVVIAAGLTGLVVHRAVRPLTALLAWSGVAGVALLYHVALLATYLLSMPTSEALRLAGYERYVGTLHLFLLALSVMVLLALANRLRWYWALVPVALAVGVTLVLTDPGVLDTTQSARNALRERADRAVARGDVRPGEAVCLVRTDGDGGYRRFMLRYLLDTPDVVEVSTLGRFTSTRLVPCTHVAVLDDDPVAVDALQALGLPVVSGEPVVMRR